ncbi:MAG: hypothetical protein KJP04_08280 [Arenicella sp.]|nr:hypothetical protein [Arenicella sp.]
MQTIEDKSRTMYGISRMDDELNRKHAWRVSLCRHGKRHVKSFPDKKYGGKASALAQAKLYRDQFLKDHPPLSRKEFCNAKRRNNRTGITGVYKYCKSYKLKSGLIKENWYWEASWPDAVGENAHKTFPVKKYGDEIARRLTIRAREEGMRGVEGTFWAAERGELKAAESNAGLISTIKTPTGQVA